MEEKKKRKRRRGKRVYKKRGFEEVLIGRGKIKNIG